ncbi:ABC transporter ATP-binding protein [Acidaminobacter hydrogenoformans]|uniref:ABC-2 type transport system ATP-binding protein n=1 Tax=Acidaminobacter hydrogenoformans DSM 2784 TaxID=1120920 RepID=A0A1G5RR14_9FIRM|nr:ABC transporter ATP-binding protein [Acidaminobacter hydrogenoformans]SCZ76494.1 ABC-2 type transport system ATP-binding protein [Acidaminobacter hydrogenoformans DSM 2784]
MNLQPELQTALDQAQQPSIQPAPLHVPQPTPKPSAQTVLALKNLKMSFGAKEVLRGVDLEAGRGEIIGYIGPNGAGKSTTVKIMLGLIEGYSGTVEILGEDIRTSGVSYKRHIGYVPETADLYDNLTPREYLTFVGELYGMSFEDADRKAEALVTLFGIKDVYHSRMTSFSKGMRQKVLLIASILHDPDILFLDEPLSGLDANSVMVVKELLEALAKAGKTIFYSSHIMDVVEKISHRIVLLDGGHIVANGTFEDLKDLNHEGSLEAIFNQLTGFDTQSETARQILQVIRGVNRDE